MPPCSSMEPYPAYYCTLPLPMPLAPLRLRLQPRRRRRSTTAAIAIIVTIATAACYYDDDNNNNYYYYYHCYCYCYCHCHCHHCLCHCYCYCYCYEEHYRLQGLSPRHFQATNSSSQVCKRDQGLPACMVPVHFVAGLGPHQIQTSLNPQALNHKPELNLMVRGLKLASGGRSLRIRKAMVRA